MQLLHFLSLTEVCSNLTNSHISKAPVHFVAGFAVNAMLPPGVVREMAWQALLFWAITAFFSFDRKRLVAFL
jgi:hypothetical protein